VKNGKRLEKTATVDPDKRGKIVVVTERVASA